MSNNLQNDELNSLENAIAQSLQQNDLFVKYNTNGIIYGVHSLNFIDVNQLEFRENLLQSIKKRTPHFNPDDSKIYISPFGEIIESFSSKITTNKKVGHPIGVGMKMVYRLNNGYSAYRVDLSREVLICSNGLTDKINIENLRWKHSSHIRLDDFFTNTTEIIANHSGEMKRLYERARSTNLDSHNVDELFYRLHTPLISKSRVKEQLKKEIDEVGANEWALSQALTNIGTHFYKGQVRNRKVLIEAGTEVLEQGLKPYLENPNIFQYSKFGQSYGALLPKEMCKN